MNQQWRRNIKKAAKEGVTVTRVDADDLERELPAFHELYRHTAERDHFTPRPLSYFQTMFAALRAEEPDRIVLYTARHEGDLVAATILVRVGGHTWYSYGASSTEKREVRGSNAVAVGDDLGRARRPAPTSTTCAASPTPSTPTTRTWVSSSSRSAPAARPSSTPASGTSR